MKTTDYFKMARDYNLLQKGKVLRILRVANITHFKQAIERRDLEEGVDFIVYNRGRSCFIRKLTEQKMKLTL